MTPRHCTFLTSETGAIAPIAALGMLLMLMFIGGAVDFERAYAAQTRLQKALDAAVLFAAKKTGGDWSLAAQDYFKTNFSETDVNGPSPLFSQGEGGTITASASLKIDTSILKVVGMETLPVVATATAVAAVPLNMEVEFTALSAQGAFAKDIFVFVRDASGQIVFEQKMLSYDYDGVTRWTTPPINQVTSRVTLTGGSTFGVMMRVYEDLSYLGRRNVSYIDHFSDEQSPRIKTTGSCDVGQTHNWEDGGDSNFADFVYMLKCYGNTAPPTPARLIN